MAPGPSPSAGRRWFGIAGAGQLIEHSPTRIAQAQQPGHLVVGLAGRVVDGGPQLDDRLAERTHMQQMGVSADLYSRPMLLGQRTVSVDVGRQMPAEMIDRADGTPHAAA